MICKNCGHSFKGNFCSNCGQSSTVRRISFRFLLHEIPNSIFQLNRGLLFTAKELCIRPGHSIREFIHGKRKAFYKPISYLLVLSAIYVLVTYLTGINTFMADIVTGVMHGIDESGESSVSKILDWALRNQTYITLLFIPFFSLASYIAFIKSEYNYFEHLVLNLYIKGHQMLIYLIFCFVITKDGLIATLPILLSIAYNVWAYFQFFEKKKSLNKILFIFLTYMLVFLAALFIIIFAVIVSEATR